MIHSKTKKSNKIISKYRYNNSSFINGFLSAFDLFGILNNFSKWDLNKYNDYNSIYSDWQIVGEDIRKSIKKNASNMSSLSK